MKKNEKKKTLPSAGWAKSTRPKNTPAFRPVHPYSRPPLMATAWRVPQCQPPCSREPATLRVSRLTLSPPWLSV